MRFFVLICLLLNFGTADASFWCQNEARISHLESNPIGKCWIGCTADTEAAQQPPINTQTALFAYDQAGDCLDSPIGSSALASASRANFLNRILATHVDTLNPFHNPDFHEKVKRFNNLNFPACLPTTQALAALRTTVLQH
jgi:hypothetical protein